MDRWNTLSMEMEEENKTDAVFLKERTTPVALRTAHEEERAVLITEDEYLDNGSERIIGFGVLWPTDVSDWFELGSLWVAREHRGNGLSHELYRRRLELLPKGANGFIVSHNPRVKRLAGDHGFIEATAKTWHDVAPYDLVCGPCDRWETDEEKVRCPYRAVEQQCQLFVFVRR